MTHTASNTAKDPARWIAEANAAAVHYGEARTFELVSVDGETPSGRKRFTYRVTDNRKTAS